jgi:hypothetical protein
VARGCTGFLGGDKAGAHPHRRSTEAQRHRHRATITDTAGSHNLRRW